MGRRKSHCLAVALSFGSRISLLNQVRQEYQDRVMNMDTCYATTIMSYMKVPRIYTHITAASNAPHIILYAPLNLLGDSKAADRPQSRTHVLCHHAQNPRHLIVSLSADPVSLVYHNKAIFILPIVKDSVGHLTGHA